MTFESLWRDLAPIGRAGLKPLACNAFTAVNAETTPSGPSNAPPSGTESRWLPTARPGPWASGSPHQAQRLPARSPTTSSPRLAAAPVNHARNVASCCVHANRR